MKVRFVLISLVFILNSLSGQEIKNINRDSPEIKKFIYSNQMNIFIDTFNFLNFSSKHLYSIRDSSLLKELDKIINDNETNSYLPELYYCGKLISIIPEKFDMHLFLEVRRYDYITPFTSHGYLINLDRNSFQVLSLMELFIHDHITTEYKMIKNLISFIASNPFNTDNIKFIYQYREEDNLLGYDFKEVEYLINKDGFVTRQ